MSLLMIILTCAVGALGVIDIRKKSVSVFALLAMLVFGIFWKLISKELGVINMLIGALPAGLLFLIVKVSRLKIGMGDILLIAVLGVALGADNVCVTLLSASVACAVFCAVLLAVGKLKKDNTVAFIPFIGAGMLVSGFLHG